MVSRDTSELKMNVKISLPGCPDKWPQRMKVPVTSDNTSLGSSSEVSSFMANWSAAPFLLVPLNLESKELWLQFPLLLRNRFLRNKLQSQDLDLQGQDSRTFNTDRLFYSRFILILFSHCQHLAGLSFSAKLLNRYWTYFSSFNSRYLLE